MRNKNDSVLLGAALGACVPVVTYALFLYFDEFIEGQKIMFGAEPFEGFDNIYMPFAIVANLIPFHYFNRRDMFNAMRGVVLPTIIFVIAWAFINRRVIF